MAKTFKKWVIRGRTFFAPSDSFAVTSLMDEIAEFARKNPDLLWKPTGKVPGLIASYALALGPKGKDILDPVAIKFKKRLARIGSIARPIFFASGLPVATTRFPRGIAFAANILSIGPIDLLISVVIAIIQIRESERTGKFVDETAIIGGEELEGRRINIFGERPFIREESSLLAEAFTETVDQLLVDLVPEGKQETQTRQLSFFIEIALRGATALAFTGIKDESAPSGEAAPSIGTGRF